MSHNQKIANEELAVYEEAGEVMNHLQDFEGRFPRLFRSCALLFAGLVLLTTALAGCKQDPESTLKAKSGGNPWGMSAQVTLSTAAFSPDEKYLLVGYKRDLTHNTVEKRGF